MEYLTPFIISIFIPNETYDLMSTCTKEMYQSSVEYSECDYNAASAIFHAIDNKTIDIEIRRKGTSTWMDMGNKPSFKVKIPDEDVNFGINGTESSEEWKTDKMVLNNKLSETVSFSPFGINPVGEKVAYEVFQKIGVISPLSRDVTVKLYRGQDKLREDSYLMIETIKNKDFVQKHWGKNTDVTIWEIENRTAVCKKDYGPLADCDNENKNSDIILDLNGINYKDNGKYFAGEKLTGHWDASCRLNNMWVANVSGGLFLIPSGLDQTFQCDAFDFLKCKTHQMCMDKVECAAQYENALNTYIRSDKETNKICTSRGLPRHVIIGMIVAIIVMVVFLVIILAMQISFPSKRYSGVKQYDMDGFL